MNAQGSLELNHRKKTYFAFVAFVGMKQIPLDCTHSGSGAYKTKVAPGLAFGTGHPGAHPRVELPFTDPARLLASHQFVPPPGLGDGKGPIDQKWEIRLTP